MGVCWYAPALMMGRMDKPIFHYYPGIVRARAAHLAKRAVERELQMAGKRATHAEIIGLVQAYRLEHQAELLAQASREVMTSPWHRAIAERQAGANLSVPTSDLDEAGIEIIEEKNTTSAIFRG
jgi:hypothetical protein